MSEERTGRMSSVLGETGVVIGNVDGVGDLEIRGRVQGSISLNGRVLIAETGVVLGNVEATHIAVAGEVRGDLSAKDGVEVQAQGRVQGNVEAPRVGIEAGARVRGMLRTGGELSAAKVAEPIASGLAQETEHLPLPEHTPTPVASRSQPARVEEPERRDEIAPPRPGAESARGGADRARRFKPSRSTEQVHRPEEKPNKAQRKKGAPPPPTFIKGARGRAK